MTDTANLDTMEANSDQSARGGSTNQVAVVCPDWNISVTFKSAAQNWPEGEIKVTFTRTGGEGEAFTPPAVTTMMQSATTAGPVSAKGRGKHTYKVEAKLTAEQPTWTFDAKDATVEDDAKVTVELTATPGGTLIFVVQEGEKALDKATLTLDHASKALTYVADAKKTPLGLATTGPTTVKQVDLDGVWEFSSVESA